MMKQREDTLKSVGTMLSDRRKEMNLSLKEAETATSIRLSYLQAIEEGEAHKKISSVYAQGFLKQYANYLGLDGEKLVREHPELFLKPEKQEFDYGIGSLEARGTHTSQLKWFPNVFWIILFVSALVVGWIVGRFFEIL